MEVQQVAQPLRLYSGDVLKVHFALGTIDRCGVHNISVLDAPQGALRVQKPLDVVVYRAVHVFLLPLGSLGREGLGECFAHRVAVFGIGDGHCHARLISHQPVSGSDHNLVRIFTCVEIKAHLGAQFSQACHHSSPGLMPQVLERIVCVEQRDVLRREVVEEPGCQVGGLWVTLVNSTRDWLLYAAYNSDLDHVDETPVLDAVLQTQMPDWVQHGQTSRFLSGGGEITVQFQVAPI